MTEDIAAKIRERATDWAENALYPRAMALAVLAVLDYCDLMDRESLRSSRLADSIRERIAEPLGISVSPLRGPNDQLAGGVRPRSGDQIGGEA